MIRKSHFSRDVTVKNHTVAQFYYGALSGLRVVLRAPWGERESLRRRLLLSLGRRAKIPQILTPAVSDGSVALAAKRSHGAALS